MFDKLALLFLIHCSLLLSVTDANIEIEKGFITSPYGSQDEKIEFYFLKPSPDNEIPNPVIYLIHGSQLEVPGKGAKDLVDRGYLQKFADEGILAVAISMPGFGHSDGIRDFAGPVSQKAAAAVIDYFSTLPFIDPNRMGIYGISRGAILSSLVHNHYPDLNFQILEAGSYDLLTRSLQLPDYLDDILQNMKREAGDSADALKERSALYHTQNVTAATLILHGEIDDRKGLPSAKQLHELLQAEGKECTLKIFSHTPHSLPKEKWSVIIPFLRERLFGIYGIGIKVMQTNPAIQVIEVYPDSQAAKSGKLQVGDAILGISPFNDDNEIEALNMPVSQFISLILGEKGSTLRLSVQHLDNSCESIVIERG